MLNLMQPFGSLPKRRKILIQKRNERTRSRNETNAPNSYVLVRFGEFRYCAKNHAGVVFDAPIQVVNETMHSFGPETKRRIVLGQKRNERTESTFLDPIVTFWFVFGQ